MRRKRFGCADAFTCHEQTIDALLRHSNWLVFSENVVSGLIGLGELGWEPMKDFE